MLLIFINVQRPSILLVTYGVKNKAPSVLAKALILISELKTSYNYVSSTYLTCQWKVASFEIKKDNESLSVSANKISKQQRD